MTWNDAIPSTASVGFFLAVLFACGFCLYMQSRSGARQILPPSLFPSLHGLSEDLARIVGRLAPEDLPTVVDAALDIIATDFAGDADIEQAIAGYRSDRQSSRALASKLRLKANLCHSACFRLEEAGREEESQVKDRKTWVLEGLYVSLESASCNPAVVDGLVSALAVGTGEPDLFASRMIAKLSAAAGIRPDTT